jgi:hypothetical protein
MLGAGREDEPISQTLLSQDESNNSYVQLKRNFHLYIIHCTRHAKYCKIVANEKRKFAN